MPEWMADEIERRREKGTSRSEYVRAALQARFDSEDAGNWDDPDVVQPDAIAES